MAALAIGGGAAAPKPAADTAKQSDALVTVDTPHYRVRTDHGALAAQLIAGQQEALYAQLSQRMGAFKPTANTSTPRLDLVVFKTKEKYLELVGPGLENSRSLFMIDKLQFVCWGAPEDFDNILETLRQECVHQFVRLNLGPKCPTWVDAGLTEFFKNAQYRSGQLFFGQAPMVPVMSVRKAIAESKFVPLSDMVGMMGEEWAAAIKVRGAEAISQFNEAWAMVHCLEAADGGKYRGPFIQYMTQIARGLPADQAWNKSFGSPPAAFEKRLRDYLQTLKPTEGLGCRQNLQLLGALVLKSHGQAADMKALQTLAQLGKLSDLTYSTGDGLKLEFTSDEMIKTLFRCPEDTSKGADPSYELAPGKDGGPMIVRCRHHYGYNLETTYIKDAEGKLNIGVAARLTSLTATPAKAGPTDTKPSAPGATKP